MKKEKKQHWLPVISDVENYPTEILTAVSNHADNKTKRLAEIADNITDRAYKMITFLVSVISALFIVGFSKNNNFYLHSACIYTAFTLIIPLFLLFRIVFIYQFHTIGVIPNRIEFEHFFADERTQKGMINHYLIEIMINQNEKINDNIKSNQQRATYLNFAMSLIVLIATFVIPILLYLVQ